MTGDVPTLHAIDGDGGEILTRRAKTPRFCRHRRFELDPTSRRVYCGECEQEIDPFAALEQIAGMFEQMKGRYDRAQREAKRVEARVTDLKREERNAKARARRGA